MASNNDASPVFEELKRAFAQRTGTSEEDWFLVFKARYGMRECFAAMRDVHGDGRVVTTLFTGCTAVDSIIAAGLDPYYAPIAPATLSVDVQVLELPEQTRALLLQHSYGMIDETATRLAAQRAHDAGALLVEDSAHCLARMARDEAGEPLADISIHSFGIEKTFSNLYFGGALWINPRMGDEAVRQRIVQTLSGLPELPARLRRATRDYRNQVRVLSHLPGGAARALRASMLARGLHEPPVAEVERLGGLPYESYLPSPWIVEQILPMFATLDDDEQRRIACVARYRELLDGLRGTMVPEAAFGIAAEQALIRFPVVLPNEGLSNSVRADLAASGFYAVDWYRMPFYPGAADISRYGVTEQEVYAYKTAYAGTIGLPCDVAPDRVDDVVSILRERV